MTQQLVAAVAVALLAVALVLAVVPCAAQAGAEELRNLGYTEDELKHVEAGLHGRPIILERARPVHQSLSHALSSKRLLLSDSNSTGTSSSPPEGSEAPQLAVQYEFVDYNARANNTVFFAYNGTFKPDTFLLDGLLDTEVRISILQYMMIHETK